MKTKLTIITILSLAFSFVMATIFSASSIVQEDSISVSTNFYMPPITIISGNDPTRIGLPDTCIDPDISIELPDFRWPWPESMNGTVYYTGGPHDYSKGSHFTATYDYGRGSGIDFAAGDKKFAVLAMASGRVIAVNCDQTDPALGCIVAIRHTGGTVLIYSHLEEHSWFRVTKRKFDEIGEFPIHQGVPIAHAGCSGTGAKDADGNCVVHLHLELRWQNLDGSCIGWENLNVSGGQIDGYWIYGYGQNGDYGPGAQMYNYDGVAVHPPHKWVSDFFYNDGGRVDNVGTYVGNDYTCDRNWDTCENNKYPLPDGVVNRDTQFAKAGGDGGILWHHNSLKGEFGNEANDLGDWDYGILESTNNISLPSPDDAAFISDVTLIDFSVVSPGQPLTKTWRMKNTGTSTWGTGYQLVFVDGEQMGAPLAMDIPAAQPDQTVDLNVPLTAPSASGDHAGFFQLRNPQGTYFGPRIWVKIRVQSNTEDSGIEVQSVTYPSVVTPGQTFRPVVTVKVNNGQLLQSRGDLLLNVDGNLFGAWPHITVIGTVNPGQTYTFQFYENDPIHAPTGEGTYETKWRVWRDGHWAGPEITIRFDVLNNGGERPAVPTLVSPANWATFTEGNPPQLCVSPASGVQFYFEIYDSHDIPASGWTSNNCWTPPGLGPYTYKWHVKARNPSNNLESDWSESRYFTLNSNQLTIDNLEFSPGAPSASENIRVYTCVHGFGGVGLGLKIEANTASDGSANGDWYWIHHLGQFCYDHSNVNTWPTWEDLPLADGDHLVRAVGFGPQGQTVEKTAIFHLNRRRPSAPKLVSPSSNAWINSTEVVFDWDASNRANTYQLLVSTNPDPSIDPIVNQVFDPSVTEYAVNFDTAYPNLYWRVIASNELGSTSSTWHFSLDWEVPVAQVEPFSSSVGYETAFSVIWGGTDNSSGIRWYDVQYREGNRPDSYWQDWVMNTTQLASTFIGQSGHTYYFRARALDLAGNISQWADGDGDTSITIDLNSRPPTPWWNSDYGFTRSLVILNNQASTLVAGYPVHLHFDGSTTPTAATLFSQSLSPVNGDDFRIVLDNSTEIPRFVQTFTPETIDIWFALEYDILPSPGQDNTNYQLYYSNSAAVSPPGDLNEIFKPTSDANTLGLWRFSEGAGAIISDASGNGNNGAASNVGWGQGKFGWAGVFNGVNSIVNLGTSNAFNLQQFSAEVWIKFTTLHDFKSIFNKHINDGSEIFDLRIEGNKIASALNHGQCHKQGNTQLTVGRWYHLAWEYDGSTTRVYVNGNLDGSVYCGLTLHSGTNTPLSLGGDFVSSTKNVDGLIQFARISNLPRNSYPYGPYANIQTEPTIIASVEIQPPVGGTSDLVINDIQVFPYQNGGALVLSRIENVGNLGSGNGFNTDLYLNHLPAGVGDLEGSISLWVNDPIPAGESVTFTTVIPGFQALGLSTSSPTEEVSGMLYAQTDSTGSTNDGDRSNNITLNGASLCIASPDAYENNDGSAENATLLTGAQLHNFDRMEDVDWVKFDAVAGRTYQIGTAGLGESADTYLYLYDQDGNTLISSNDDWGGSLASLIYWTAPANGVYYIRVRQWNPIQAGCGTSYTLSVNSEFIFIPAIFK